MKKLLIAFNLGLLLNSSFAEDIFLISTKNSCVLTNSQSNNQNYIDKLNKSKNWFAYKDTQLISKKVNILPVSFDSQVCPDNINVNEKDMDKIKLFDYITTKQTPSAPKLIQHHNTELKTQSLLKDWIFNEYKINPLKIKHSKSFLDLEFNHQIYELIEFSSSNDFNEYPKKGDFSFVVLLDKQNNHIIPVESWISSKTSQDILKIDNFVEGLIDIDNDGEYELMINSSYYEGSSSFLYKIINGKAIKKRSCGCGV